VLDNLTPEQRVAFVLHDAFSVPFSEIAEILGVTEPTARQHASRGRRAAAEAEKPDPTDLGAQREIVEKLLGAILSGNLDGVVELLHPDAVLIGDSNGKARSSRRRIVGADKITRFLAGLVEMYGVHRLLQGELVLVNGTVGLAMRARPAEDGLRALDRRVTTFDVHDGQVSRIYDIVNPDKLTRLPL
jgi:RNA polymerase sigma-70 factor (ECF subfamily)